MIARQSVSQPVQTGLKAIDAMVPIGRGQRELIIGDRQTGKTAVAIDTIINQKGKDLFCVYVAIGQKASTIANVVRKLEEHGAMAYTIVVAASASESAAMQYIAPVLRLHHGRVLPRPRPGCAHHLRRPDQAGLGLPPGVAAVAPAAGARGLPGDVFYLHSRLLERGARVNPEYVEKFTKGAVKGKTGSLTALPVIETQAGDVTAFVPTNVISITDGQIFLETDLFNAGIRPAINAGISVSRVGGAAQTKIMKRRDTGGGVRLALAQYRELAAFAQFASDLDEATRKQLERGRMVTELMKQPQYQPLQVWEMAVTLFAVNNGYFDDIDVKKALSAEKSMRDYIKSKYAALVQRMEEKKDLSAEDEKALTRRHQGLEEKRVVLAMPGTKEIRMKIRSVQNTRKITKAMEMVAASKMRKAQERMRHARPYGEKIRNVAAHISHANPEYRHPFLIERDSVKRVGIIVITTDKGLCGALNTNLLRMVLAQYKEWQAQGEEIDACAIGNKGLGFMQRLGANIVSQVVQLGDRPQMDKLIGAVKLMLDGYSGDRFDRLMLAYTRFINTMKQEPVIEQLLPLSGERLGAPETVWDYIYEPEARGVLDQVMTRYIEALIYQAVSENMASEQSARMVAMKAASDNAGDLIDELTLIYNKNRQAAITKELSEIVGGAAAV